MKSVVLSLRSSGKLKLTTLVIISCLFSLMLEAFRVYYSHSIIYLFLIWNLFLASIPFMISSYLYLMKDKINSKLLLAVLLFAWLIFFPNAPYIMTDFFHLQNKNNVPLWFDTGLIISFSWNGLIMGFLSLQDIQSVLDRFVGKLFSWIFTLVSIILAGFGIYLGRFGRWNSWDIFINPKPLFMDIAHKVVNPLSHPRTILVTMLFSVFLILGYLLFSQLRKSGAAQNIRN